MDDRGDRKLEEIRLLLCSIAGSMQWVTFWLFVIAFNSCRPH